MTRRNAFARTKQEPQQPISTIPLAGKRKRRRTWESAHPGAAYFIPSHLHEPAKDVRTAILGLSQKHMTTTSSVATALISFSLAHVRQGKLKLEARPDADRRKMTLTWEEVNDDWSREIPQPVKLAKKGMDNYVYLNYRWGKDVEKQIKALAGDAITRGEVVVFLLQYAITAHKNGRLRLKEETVVIAQKVSATW